MAFSQKFSGLILVPYFNKAEWEYVAKCLISKAEEKLKKALNIMKIWKQRTPILPAGIEGTLIVLEAMLMDEGNIPEHRLARERAAALTTFLNVAVHNDKQGTFNKIVSKSFSKWVIDMRHDFCHGTNETSNDNLKVALNQCFDWILEEYWVQTNSLKDYVIEEAVNTNIIDCLITYIKLTLNIYKEVTMGEEFEHLMNKANYLAKRYNLERLNPTDLQKVLEETLNQELSNPNSKKLSGKIAELLVDTKALFHTHLKKDEIGGRDIIPKPFRKLWTNLLNLLFNHGFLEDLLDKLLDAASNFAKETAMRLSCLWICDILDGLLKLRNIEEFKHTAKEQKLTGLELTIAVINFKSKIEKDVPAFIDCTEFKSSLGFATLNLKNFEAKMHKKPSQQYIHFSDKVMTLNQYPEEYVNLLRLLYQNRFDCSHFSADKLKRNIYTVADITLDTEQIEKIDVDDSQDDASTKASSEVIIVEEPIRWNRWRRVTNISDYKNCPLGVGPNQNADANPHIPID